MAAGGSFMTHSVWTYLGPGWFDDTLPGLAELEAEL